MRTVTFCRRSSSAATAVSLLNRTTSNNNNVPSFLETTTRAQSSTGYRNSNNNNNGSSSEFTDKAYTAWGASSSSSSAASPSSNNNNRDRDSPSQRGNWQPRHQGGNDNNRGGGRGGGRGRGNFDRGGGRGRGRGDFSRGGSRGGRSFSSSSQLYSDNINTNPINELGFNDDIDIIDASESKVVQPTQFTLCKQNSFKSGLEHPLSMFPLKKSHTEIPSSSTTLLERASGGELYYYRHRSDIYQSVVSHEITALLPDELVEHFPSNKNNTNTNSQQDGSSGSNRFTRATVPSDKNTQSINDNNSNSNQQHLSALLQNMSPERAADLAIIGFELLSNAANSQSHHQTTTSDTTTTNTNNSRNESSSFLLPTLTDAGLLLALFACADRGPVYLLAATCYLLGPLSMITTNRDAKKSILSRKAARSVIACRMTSDLISSPLCDNSEKPRAPGDWLSLHALLLANLSLKQQDAEVPSENTLDFSSLNNKNDNDGNNDNKSSSFGKNIHTTAAQRIIFSIIERNITNFVQKSMYEIGVSNLSELAERHIEQQKKKQEGFFDEKKSFEDFDSALTDSKKQSGGGGGDLWESAATSEGSWNNENIDDNNSSEKKKQQEQEQEESTTTTKLQQQKPYQKREHQITLAENDERQAWRSALIAARALPSLFLTKALPQLFASWCVIYQQCSNWKGLRSEYRNLLALFVNDAIEFSKRQNYLLGREIQNAEKQTQRRSFGGRGRGGSRGRGGGGRGGGSPTTDGFGNDISSPVVYLDPSVTMIRDQLKTLEPITSSPPNLRSSSTTTMSDASTSTTANFEETTTTTADNNKDSLSSSSETQQQQQPYPSSKAYLPALGYSHVHTTRSQNEAFVKGASTDFIMSFAQRLQEDPVKARNRLLAIADDAQTHLVKATDRYLARKDPQDLDEIKKKLRYGARICTLHVTKNFQHPVLNQLAARCIAVWATLMELKVPDTQWFLRAIDITGLLCRARYTSIPRVGEFGQNATPSMESSSASASSSSASAAVAQEESSPSLSLMSQHQEDNSSNSITPPTSTSQSSPLSLPSASSSLATAAGTVTSADANRISQLFYQYVRSLESYHWLTPMKAHLKSPVTSPEGPSYLESLASKSSSAAATEQDKNKAFQEAVFYANEKFHRSRESRNSSNNDDVVNNNKDNDSSNETTTTTTTTNPVSIRDRAEIEVISDSVAKYSLFLGDFERLLRPLVVRDNNNNVQYRALVSLQSLGPILALLERAVEAATAALPRMKANPIEHAASIRRIASAMNKIAQSMTFLLNFASPREKIRQQCVVFAETALDYAMSCIELITESNHYAYALQTVVDSLHATLVLTGLVRYRSIGGTQRNSSQFINIIRRNHLIMMRLTVKTFGIPARLTLNPRFIDAKDDLDDNTGEDLFQEINQNLLSTTASQNETATTSDDNSSSETSATTTPSTTSTLATSTSTTTTRNQEAMKREEEDITMQQRDNIDMLGTLEVSSDAEIRNSILLLAWRALYSPEGKEHSPHLIHKAVSLGQRMVLRNITLVKHRPKLVTLGKVSLIIYALLSLRFLPQAFSKTTSLRVMLKTILSLRSHICPEQSLYLVSRICQLLPDSDIITPYYPTRREVQRVSGINSSSSRSGFSSSSSPSSSSNSSDIKNSGGFRSENFYANKTRGANTASTSGNIELPENLSLILSCYVSTFMMLSVEEILLAERRVEVINELFHKEYSVGGSGKGDKPPDLLPMVSPLLEKAESILAPVLLSVLRDAPEDQRTLLLQKLLKQDPIFNNSYNKKKMHRSFKNNSAGGVAGEYFEQQGQGQEEGEEQEEDCFGIEILSYFVCAISKQVALRKICDEQKQQTQQNDSSSSSSASSSSSSSSSRTLKPTKDLFNLLCEMVERDIDLFLDNQLANEMVVEAIEQIPEQERTPIQQRLFNACLFDTSSSNINQQQQQQQDEKYISSSSPSSITASTTTTPLVTMERIVELLTNNVVANCGIRPTDKSRWNQLFSFCSSNSSHNNNDNKTKQLQDNTNYLTSLLDFSDADFRSQLSEQELVEYLLKTEPLFDPFIQNIPNSYFSSSSRTTSDGNSNNNNNNNTNEYLAFCCESTSKTRVPPNHFTKIVIATISTCMDYLLRVKIPSGKQQEEEIEKFYATRIKLIGSILPKVCLIGFNFRILLDSRLQALMPILVEELFSTSTTSTTTTTSSSSSPSTHYQIQQQQQKTKEEYRDAIRFCMRIINAYYKFGAHYLIPNDRSTKFLDFTTVRYCFSASPIPGTESAEILERVSYGRNVSSPAQATARNCPIALTLKRMTIAKLKVMVDSCLMNLREAFSSSNNNNSNTNNDSNNEQNVELSSTLSSSSPVSPTIIQDTLTVVESICVSSAAPRFCGPVVLEVAKLILSGRCRIKTSSSSSSSCTSSNSDSANNKNQTEEDSSSELENKYINNPELDTEFMERLGKFGLVEILPQTSSNNNNEPVIATALDVLRVIILTYITLQPRQIVDALVTKFSAVLHTSGMLSEWEIPSFNVILNGSSQSQIADIENRYNTLLSQSQQNSIQLDGRVDFSATQQLNSLSALVKETRSYSLARVIREDRERCDSKQLVTLWNLVEVLERENFGPNSLRAYTKLMLMSASDPSFPLSAENNNNKDENNNSVDNSFDSSLVYYLPVCNSKTKRKNDTFLSSVQTNQARSKLNERVTASAVDLVNSL